MIQRCHKRITLVSTVSLSNPQSFDSSVRYDSRTSVTGVLIITLDRLTLVVVAKLVSLFLAPIAVLITALETPLAEERTAGHGLGLGRDPAVVGCQQKE